MDKFWPITLKKQQRDIMSFKDEGAKQHMPGSLEDYVQRIFAVASNGSRDSPAHPTQKQWALGVTQVFMKGSVKKLIH